MAPVAPPKRPRLMRAARKVYQGLAWLLAALIAVQVFTAGVAVESDPTWWAQHRSFVHVFELLPLIMLLPAVLGRGTRALLGLTVLAFFLIGIQYAFIGARPSPVAGLHAVNALVLFALALTLAMAAGGNVLGRLRAWKPVAFTATRAGSFSPPPR